RHTRFSRDWSSDVCSSDLDVDVERFIQLSQRYFAKRGMIEDAYIIYDAINGVFFPDDAQDLFRLAGVGQIAGVQIPREIDILRVARQAHDVTALVGELLADRPPNAFRGACYQHTFILHSVVSWNR